MQMQLDSDLLSVVSSVVSIILGFFAIWLSVVFYRWSNDASTRISDSAEKIAASVSKLETLFDRLYADTFSMMKDTVSDMRKHIWPAGGSREMEQEATFRAEQKIAALQSSVGAQIDALVSGQQATNTQIREVTSQLQAIVSRAIDESRKIQSQAREETVRERILAAYWEASKTRSIVTPDALLEFMGDRAMPMRDLFTELFNLRDEGVARWEGNGISNNTPVAIATARSR